MPPLADADLQEYAEVLMHRELSSISRPEPFAKGKLDALDDPRKTGINLRRDRPPELS